MLSISSLVEFLLGLLRDDQVQADFARDPQATLAAHGLSGVTAQDIRDVRPLLADHHGVRSCGDGDDRGGHRSHDGGGHRSGYEQAAHHPRPGHDGSAHDDPVREIHHVTQNYEVDRSVVVKNTTHEYNEYNTYEFNHYDNSVQAGDGATVIKDSFNQDNDGVDNKGGVIDDSVVGGGNVADSGNSTEVTAIEDSFNDDHSETVSDAYNETATTTLTDSLNDNSTTVSDSYDTDNSTTVSDSYDTDNSTTVSDSFSGSTVNNSYAVNAPTAAVDATGDEAGATAAA
jgi:hypothetical protein